MAVGGGYLLGLLAERHAPAQDAGRQEKPGQDHRAQQGDEPQVIKNRRQTCVGRRRGLVFRLFRLFSFHGVVVNLSFFGHFYKY
ncbi:hypothetical protein F4X86_01810 [Candidatus Saccharibacteria bacterium]|nr:hypothetical protein [Candidatus Saccharibacteria bacterium]